MATAVSELVKADWPNFNYLCLSHSDLDAYAAAVILDLDLDPCKVQRQSDAHYIAACVYRNVAMVAEVR